MTEWLKEILFIGIFGEYPWPLADCPLEIMANKPVGDNISAPRSDVVAMATRVGPHHFAWFHWIGHPRKPPGRPKHLRSMCHTSRLIGDFVQLQILGSKFWALGGLNQKSEKNFCRVPHGELMAKNGSIPLTNKKEAIWRSTVTDRHTDRVNDKKILDS